MENTRVQTVRLKPRGWPRIKPGPPKPPKKFRNTLTSYKMKWAVIESFDSVGMAETLARFFPHHNDGRLDSTRKKVYQWTQNRVLIRNKASFRGAACQVGSVDADRRCSVTPRMIQVMAFTASWSWFQVFKRRFKLTLRARTRIGQDTQGDGDKALATFAARVAQVVCDNNMDVVYNADQTAVNYEYLPTKTLNAKGEHTIWVKYSGKTKDRATAMVMADSTGKKYPVFVVMKTKASKVKAVVQENLTQRHGFGKTVWKEVEPQPADVAWIRPMKAHLRQMWIDSIRRQVLRHKSQTETFQLQAPKRPTLLRWITGAWSGLADSIILNGFAKCKIGAEVEVVSEPSEEVMSSDMLSDLVARCAIEDTIDPLDDLDINSDDE
ncbi:hypothetical protein DYB28_004925 [Aphanomyces astaci]|uniref:DDE-1 domain-containing protein n=1 Tax=Aphanomyces astaci TaxID=112090 RepID=A0A9X8H9H2_APHAT|nr:hypothetical protein DYB28_004925 [Aphanomyces astaci]